MLALMVPDASNSVNLAYRLLPKSRCTCTVPNTFTTLFPSSPSLMLGIGPSTTMNWPFGARTFQPFCWVSGSAMASNTTLGAVVRILLASDTMSALRLMMCVAPSDLRKWVLWREAVVTIGEKPEKFASWMAMDDRCNW